MQFGTCRVFDVPIGKKAFVNLGQGIGDFLNTDAQEQLNATEAADGTTMTPQVNEFKTTAKQIADAQENSLYTSQLFGLIENQRRGNFYAFAGF